MFCKAEDKTDQMAKKASVLYVDDEPNALKYFTREFTHEFEIVTSESALDALREIERRPQQFDIVIADYRMPELSGANFLQTIAERAPNAKRVLTTAYASVSCLCDVVNEGHVDHIFLKPWDVKNIRDRLVALTGDVGTLQSKEAPVAEVDFYDMYFRVIRNAVAHMNFISACILGSPAFGEKSDSKIAKRELPNIQAAMRVLRREIQLSKNLLDDESLGKDPSPFRENSQVLSIKACVEECLNSLNFFEHCDIRFDVSESEDFFVTAPKHLIRATLTDIFGEMLETAKDEENPRVLVDFRKGQDENLILIADNFNWCQHERVARYSDPFAYPDSRKGLGLALVSMFARSFGMKIDFDIDPLGAEGLRTIISVPVLRH